MSLKKVRDHHVQKILNDVNRLLANNSHIDALKILYKELNISPNLPVLINKTAIIEAKNGQLEKSHALFKKLIKISNHSSYKYNFANLLVLQEKHNDALSIFRKITSDEPENFKFNREYGVILLKLGQSNQAVKAFHKALEINNQDYDVIYAYSTALIMNGQLELGWKLYENRFKHSFLFKEVGVASREIFSGNLPKYNGEDLSNKSLLIHDEQGYGDFIHVMRYFLLLKNKYRKLNIYVVCKQPLVKLLLHHDQITAVYSYEQQNEINAINADYWDFIMSIPKYFEKSYVSFNHLVPYINHKKELKTELKKLVSDSKINIGISYHGNPNYMNEKYRSLGSLKKFSEILALKECNFIYLDIDNIEEQKKQLGLNIQTTDAIHSFDDTYSIIKKLDLVISTDTAIVHLAGAAGAKCWVLLSGISASWIWGDFLKHTPRYPTLRLYRQNKPGDWNDVFKEVLSDLRVFVERKKLVFSSRTKD